MPSLIALCSIIIAHTIITWENQLQQSGGSIQVRKDYTMLQSMQKHQESKLMSY